MDTHARRELLELLYRDMLHRLNPGDAVTRDGLATADTTALRQAARRHLLAIGKASAPMASAVVAWCAENTSPVHGGICVSHAADAFVPAPISLFIGDHPTPGARSSAAADAIGRYIATEVAAGDHVVVLLSGGTSALIGAPRTGISAEQFARCNDALLGGGLSIDAINAVRRRLSRWSDGRLGDAIQDRGATVEVFLISDVLRGGVAVVGSGPCMRLPDGAHDGHVSRMGVVPQHAAFATLLLDTLDAAESAPAPVQQTRQTRIEHLPIRHTTVNDSQHATRTIAKLARERGLAAHVMRDPLLDDVAMCAATIARALLDARAQQYAASAPMSTPTLLIWCGEPTVVLPERDAPLGGRMQALALLVARALAAAGDDARGITLLAAGTDGRDGPTDAAGAVISAATWSAIAAAGREPDADVSTWNSSTALASVSALIPAFSSGTNVNDVVVGLVT
jgi:glycerate 2-kinase